MKRFAATLILLAALSVAANGQTAPVMTKTGTTAAQFLKIGAGPRAIGMGGAYVSVADDITAMYWNPAGLARMQTGEAVFNHVNWILDVSYDAAGASLIIDGVGTLAAGAYILNDGEMDVTTTDNPEGTGERFSAGAYAATVSFARALTDQFSIGFTAKYVGEYIWNETATAVALDFGTMYEAPVFNGLRIGASMSNFGPQMQLSGPDIKRLYYSGPGGLNIVNTSLEMDSYDLPLLFRVGISTDALHDENNRITLAVDAVHPNDNTEYLNSGLEYAWSDVVFLRAGWKSLFQRGTEEGLTAGAGVQYAVATALDLKFDYAYQDFGRLGAVHYFSLGVKF